MTFLSGFIEESVQPDLLVLGEVLRRLHRAFVRISSESSVLILADSARRTSSIATFMFPMM